MHSPFRLALPCACLAACVTSPPPALPRPAIPLPPSVAAEFDLRGPVTANDVAVVKATTEHTYWRGQLACGDEIAKVHVLVPRADAPRPLVICLPILAGGADLMWNIAEGMVERGFAAAWADRVAPALCEPQRGKELDQLFRRTVRHNRMLVRWSERREDLFAPGRCAVLGVSTGGILGAVLLALEPQLDAGALCLAGADLPAILSDSREPRVERWRAWRAAADGLAGQALRHELARELTIDPARFAPHVDTARVFLVHAGCDDVVPQAQHRVLWESLGRPADLRLACLGHYSAALALDAILDAVAAFYRRRLAEAA